MRLSRGACVAGKEGREGRGVSGCRVEGNEGVYCTVQISEVGKGEGNLDVGG